MIRLDSKSSVLKTNIDRLDTCFTVIIMRS